MNQLSKIHLGLDVHKDSITVACADPGREPARVVSKVPHDLGKLLKVLAKLGRPEQLHLVYEAGPTGFGLQRRLSELGYRCEVIAPSKAPRKPGARVKTDGRDACALAQSSRAGDLHAVWVPDVADEAIRDLSRVREDAVKACTQAKQQLGGMLLRRGLRYPGKTAWTRTYFAWLAGLKLDAEAAQVALTEYLLAVQAAITRVQRLDQALADSIVGWRFEPVVAALQALRGVARVSAIGLVAEIGDLSRFAHPRQLMAYLGLVPSERSSGERVRRGSITKTGNAHARRLLTEAAWSYRHSARIGRDALQRQATLSQPVRQMAWKAQLRLTRRFASLNGRGVQPNKVCVAVARELAGFVWAVGMQALSEKALSEKPAAA
jgi:transposase